jgi:tetratricopeptide (TPR) repeat protein
MNALFADADHFMKIGRYDEAIALYTRFLESDANNTTAIENLGRAYYALGKHENAIV